MVRRWSYINSVNTLQSENYRIAEKSFFDVSINSTMYLRKHFALSTRLTRKQWARRKRLHNWVAVSNVLKDWSRSYRFYRNHSKLALNQFLTRTSLIAFNVTGLRNVFPGLYRGSGEFLTGTYTRKLHNYFSSYPNSRFSNLKNLKSANVIFVSCFLPPREPEEFLSTGFLLALSSVRYTGNSFIRSPALPDSSCVPAQTESFTSLLASIWAYFPAVYYLLFNLLALRSSLK